MEQILFSIIVVCLNPGDKLEKTITSIRKQTWGNYEIIVKDGLSADGSVEKLPEDGRIKLVRKKDRGIYDAMNQAAAEVKGDYVYFLNCGDVFYDENVLDTVRTFMERVPSVKSRNGRIYYGDIYDRLTGERIASHPSIDAFVCYRNVPCHQACIYGAGLVRDRAFDISYKVRADYDHFLRCFFKEKVEAFYIPVIIADYEGGGFSESKDNIKKSAEEHRQIVRKYMTPGQIYKYRMIMLFTLAPLRTWLSHNERTAHCYQWIKRRLYLRKNQEKK